MSLEGMHAIDDMWDWAPKRDRKNKDTRSGNHPAVVEDSQTQQTEPAFSWPANVQDGFIEAGVRLHDLTKKMKHPENLPEHISPEQARFTIDRAMALIKQRADASTRQFIISSIPLTVEKTYTNGTNGNGTNGHSKNGTNGHHPIPLEISAVPARPLAATRL